MVLGSVRDDRQEQVGRMNSRVQDRLLRQRQLRRGAQLVTRVQVAGEAREIARRLLHVQAAHGTTGSKMCEGRSASR